MRQSLIIDADDTLWENNIYFERAFEAFVAYLDHSKLSAEEIRTIFDEMEAVNNKTRGYGSLNFGRNLQQCYEHLCERELSDVDLDKVMDFAHAIIDQPVELIDGVKDTLEYLVTRHDLTLFTKGHAEEQKLKIDRSGLGIYFGHTAIVKEKDSASYRQLVAERRLDTGITWMIGNSPRSDINAALEAGLNAVFVPHARTWILEKQALLEGPGKLLKLESFRDLTRHF